MEKLNPYYVSGIVDGEGWFGVSLSVKNELAAGFQVSLNFGLAMNCRDSKLIFRIKEHFDCGIVTIKKNGMTEYRVRSFDDIVTKIIPFFDMYKLQSEKNRDFEYIKIIAKLMQDKKHLTKDGVDFVRSVKNNMHVYNCFEEIK